MGIGHWLKKRTQRGHAGKPMPTVLIVGSPNVGKSVLFHRLTGRYVTVSNYPGTTVEVSKGVMHYRSHLFRVMDSPGIYSFNPITEEERVSKRIVMNHQPDLVLHIVDAKNLERMLPLTLQLLEAHLRVILVLNMMDELQKEGLNLNIEHLQQRLQIPVVPTVCLNGRGIPELKEQIYDALRNRFTPAV
jgi:ferrous iron transport protein B